MKPTHVFSMGYAVSVKQIVMKTAIIIIIATLITLPALASEGDAYHPDAFKDADSPWVDGQELRIANGIDAPELTQPCTKDGKAWFAGQVASIAVGEMVAGQDVVCTDTGGRSYKRPLVTCTVNGEDLAAMIVRAGWAFEYPKYSGGQHTATEAAARAAKRGIWAGVCEKPWVWRHKSRK